MKNYIKPTFTLAGLFPVALAANCTIADDEKEFLDNVDMLADRAFEDQCTNANPRLPLVSELKQIMLDAYYGKEI